MSMGISRRQTLTGAAVVGVGVPLLAACGSDEETATEPEVATGEKLGPAAEVPVGGGVIYADQKVVVTQPAEGEFKAFSSICTHSGCPVTAVKDGTINCNCHGSKFSIEDGSVSNGPANKPLAKVEVTVKGDEIVTS